MDRIVSGTPDLTQENIKKLAELFPDVVTEGEDTDPEPKARFGALSAAVSAQWAVGCRCIPGRGRAVVLPRCRLGWPDAGWGEVAVVESARASRWNCGYGREAATLIFHTGWQIMRDESSLVLRMQRNVMVSTSMPCARAALRIGVSALSSHRAQMRMPGICGLSIIQKPSYDLRAMAVTQTGTDIVVPSRCVPCLYTRMCPLFHLLRVSEGRSRQSRLYAASRFLH